MKLSDLPEHHAVLVVHPNREATATTLWEELRKLSPAHRFFNQTVLDIDTSRDIIAWTNTPYNDEKIALISFHTAGIPAQNAMLKILEEPRAGVRFILLTSNKENLLGTVLSRVRHVEADGGAGKVSHEAFEFLQTPHGLRMKLPNIVQLLSQVDEEGRKNRESVRAFILELAETLSKEKAAPNYIVETLEVSSYASDPSASGKALLEYLTLLLPQLKN